MHINYLLIICAFLLINCNFTKNRYINISDNHNVLDSCDFLLLEEIPFKNPCILGSDFNALAGVYLKYDSLKYTGDGLIKIGEAMDSSKNYLLSINFAKRYYWPTLDTGLANTECESFRLKFSIYSIKSPSTEFLVKILNTKATSLKECIGSTPYVSSGILKLRNNNIVTTLYISDTLYFVIKSNLIGINIQRLENYFIENEAFNFYTMPNLMEDILHSLIVVVYLFFQEIGLLYYQKKICFL